MCKGHSLTCLHTCTWVLKTTSAGPSRSRYSSTELRSLCQRQVDTGGEEAETLLCGLR